MTKFSIRKNRANIVGSFPSLKNATSVYYESTIERDLLFFLEYDQSVSSYHMHPFTISYDDRETHHSYTPDVLVVRSTTKTLIECKPKTLLDDPHTQQQIMIGSQWCEQHNHIFEVITDRDLRKIHVYQILNYFGDTLVLPNRMKYVAMSLCCSQTLKSYLLKP